MRFATGVRKGETERAGRGCSRDFRFVQLPRWFSRVVRTDGMIAREEQVAPVTVVGCSRADSSPVRPFQPVRTTDFCTFSRNFRASQQGSTSTEITVSSAEIYFTTEKKNPAFQFFCGSLSEGHRDAPLTLRDGATLSVPFRTIRNGAPASKAGTPSGVREPGAEDGTVIPRIEVHQLLVNIVVLVLSGWVWDSA